MSRRSPRLGPFLSPEQTLSVWREAAPGFAPAAPTARRALLSDWPPRCPGPCGGPAGCAARTGSHRLNNSPGGPRTSRLGSPAPTRLPGLRQNRVGLPGPSWLTGSASHALGFHSSHLSAESGCFFVLSCFYRLQRPELCPAPPIYCQVLERRREGDRRPERGRGSQRSNRGAGLWGSESDGQR